MRNALFIKDVLQQQHVEAIQHQLDNIITSERCTALDFVGKKTKKLS